MNFVKLPKKMCSFAEKDNFCRKRRRNSVFFAEKNVPGDDKTTLETTITLIVTFKKRPLVYPSLPE